MGRSLSWFFDGQAVAGSKGPAYRLDKDYDASLVWLYAETAPTGSNIEVDIKADGVSIFGDNKPILTPGSTEGEETTFRYDLGALYEGTVITLEVTAVGSKVTGDKLSVQFDLEDIS